VLAFTDPHRDNRARRSLASRARARASASINISALTLTLLLTGCTLGPNYSREAAPVPADFKETKGWKRATPSDDLARGAWWTVYKDHALDTLLPQIEVSNQTVAAAAAAYEEARAVIREAQSALFPVATVGYSVTRTRTGPLALGANTSAGAGSFGGVTGGRGAIYRTSYTVPISATYDIVNNQYKAGYAVTAGDVATADAQIATTEAQLANARLQRAQFEHAIAVLTGRPPAELGIGPRNLGQHIPKTPVTVPSVLLERRPDIAAAERTMQEQNALIGVAEAAWFPDVSLSAMIQYIGPIPLPLNISRSIASIGASATETIFNGGLTAAQVDAARAAYWQSVANYRQTVLTAFQQVEDELAAIRYLSRQVEQERRAVMDQRTAVDVFLNQFRAGTVAFTTVVVAEIQLLADQEAELTARQNLFLASVSLIVALGGGWDTLLLPTQVQLQRDFSLPQLESQPSPAGIIPSDILVPPPLAPPPASQQ
jgi:outer membrane protein TolC